MENLASEFHSQQSDSDSQNLIQLKPISLLPPQYQRVFSEFTYFNAVQSNFVETLLETDQSVVVSAPTGSGKTVLFEMAILKLLLDVDNGVYLIYQSVVVSAPTGSGKTVLFEMAILKLLLDVDNGVYDTIHDIKAVYISPLKSLCSEKYNVWKTKFVEAGGHQLRIAEITGDTVDQ
ncbi:probable ATP-dependent DNA helicase HFM1, partial [Diaphorina citri]|uniref:Probable ATP-dependent DNA helicase HFM1 n=1 Tax=Diaphorina citri TaxID=121845 RepID=A0A3Q0JIA7_DIACI